MRFLKISSVLPDTLSNHDLLHVPGEIGRDPSTPSVFSTFDRSQTQTESVKIKSRKRVSSDTNKV